MTEPAAELPTQLDAAAAAGPEPEHAIRPCEPVAPPRLAPSHPPALPTQPVRPLRPQPLRFGQSQGAARRRADATARPTRHRQSRPRCLPPLRACRRPALPPPEGPPWKPSSSPLQAPRQASSPQACRPPEPPPSRLRARAPSTQALRPAPAAWQSPRPQTRLLRTRWPPLRRRLRPVLPRRPGRRHDGDGERRPAPERRWALCLSARALRRCGGDGWWQAPNRRPASPRGGASPSPIWRARGPPGRR